MASRETERRCRWCLTALPAAASARRVFCDQTCRVRHYSRSQYADADGYGAELAALNLCVGCGDTFTVAARQGAHPRKYCTTCRPTTTRDRQ